MGVAHWRPRLLRISFIHLLVWVKQNTIVLGILLVNSCN
jgi:hypothetical protein